ncbi:hypothetical protein ID866_2734 [Astraeus odoratus]|nr:hypothetical protein ID866_2734 [Astraeus odoratus]
MPTRRASCFSVAIGALPLFLPFVVASSFAARDDEHVHMHHAQPLTEINETDILVWHLPTPPSYWSIDIEDLDPSVPRYPALMALHVTFMMLAFFVALPAGNAPCP